MEAVVSTRTVPCSGDKGAPSAILSQGADPVRDFRLMGGEKEFFFRSLWQEYRIRPGLSVSVLDASLEEDFSFNYRKENRYIDFGFFLEGDFVNDMLDTPLGRVAADNRAGMGGVGFLRHMTGSVNIPSGMKLRLVHMHVLPEVLVAMLGGDMDVVQPGLRNVLEREDAADFFSQRCMSPKSQTVANELFFGVRNNSGINLYMEGKALELLGLCFMEGECPAGKRSKHLCPRELDVIDAIRRELEEHHASPPTLEQLSRTYYMGAHKIQAGFRSLFGLSVFGFLKEFRLQRARLLFEEGNMNVSEVAWAIGYINLSHFSAAFRKRFGVLPKAYLKSIRANACRPTSRVA